MQQRGVLHRWWRGAPGTSVLLATAFLAACTGKIGANADAGQVSVGGATTFGPTGLHRLSRIEYDNTLADLLRDTSRSGFAALPEDVNDPFDNDFTTQQPSGILVDSGASLSAAPTRLRPFAFKAIRRHGTSLAKHIGGESESFDLQPKNARLF